MADDNKTGWSSNVSAVADLLKAAFWPAIALVIFLDFHQDVKDTIHKFPDKLAEASVLEFGSFKMDMQVQAAKSGGDAALVSVLGDLNSAEIGALLGVSKTTFQLSGEGMRNADGTLQPIRTLPKDQELQTLLSLADKGLLNFSIGVDALKADLTQVSLRDDPTGRRDFDFPNPNKTAGEQLATVSYQLSERGKEAFDAIVSAVAQQLAPAGGSAPAQ